MRAIRLALFFAVGLILGGGSVAAFAAATGNAMAWVGAGGMVWKARDGSIRSLSNPYWNGFGAAENGGVMGRLAQKAALQGGGSLVIDIGRNIPASTIGRLGAQLAKLGGPAALGLTLAPLIWDEVSQRWLAEDTDEAYKGQQTIDQFNGCVKLAGVGNYAFDPATQTLWRVARAEDADLWAAQGYVAANNCTQATWYSPSPAGYWPQLRKKVNTTEPEMGQRPATDAEIADTIVFQGQQFDRMSDIAQKILESGRENELIADAGPIQSSGPASVAGGQTTSTTTSPQGTSTTTTNVTHNVTYNSNVINITTTTTSTTIHPDGTQTTTEETATAPDGAQQEEQQYTLDYTKPEPLEVPDFYEQQYPDGFAGEWGEFSDRVAASSLAGFIGSLSNGVPSGGECPAWSFNLNMGAMGNFGTFALQPPCIIWPFIKTLLILTALFVARRMVVGG